MFCLGNLNHLWTLASNLMQRNIVETKNPDMISKLVNKLEIHMFDLITCFLLTFKWSPYITISWLGLFWMWICKLAMLLDQLIFMTDQWLLALLKLDWSFTLSFLFLDLENLHFRNGYMICVNDPSKLSRFSIPKKLGRRIGTV